MSLGEDSKCKAVATQDEATAIKRCKNLKVVKRFIINLDDQKKEEFAVESKFTKKKSTII